jgi:hypothetical protein
MGVQLVDRPVLIGRKRTYHHTACPKPGGDSRPRSACPCMSNETHEACLGMLIIGEDIVTRPENMLHVFNQILEKEKEQMLENN